MTSELQAYADARATLLAARPDLAWPLERLLLAHAWYESRWGRFGNSGPTSLAGSNNWGSYQSTPQWAAKHAHDPGYGVLSYTDTHGENGGGAYAAGLRIYPSQRAAVDEWLPFVEGYTGPLASFDATASYPTRELRAGGAPDGVGAWDAVSEYAWRLHYAHSWQYFEASWASYVNALHSALAHVDELERQRIAQGLAGDANVARGEPLDPVHARLFVAAATSSGGDGAAAPFSSASPCSPSGGGFFAGPEEDTKP